MLVAHCDAAGRAACALVGLCATVAVPCAVFVAAFSLCLWALGREEGTPADVLAACHNGTPGCVLAALWHSRDVLARLFAVSFYLFSVLLVHDLHDGEDESDGLEEEVRELREVSRGQQASASTGQRLVRRPPRSSAARETTAEHVSNIATAGPSSPVLPGTGRSTVSPTHAPSSRSAPQGPGASRGRSASLSRSTGPLWTLCDAVLVSLSRRISAPPGGARRASKESKDPTGQRVSTKRTPKGPGASRGRSASLSRSTGPLWTLRDAVLVSLSRSRRISAPPGGARRASKEPTGQLRRWSPTGTSRHTSPTGTSRRGIVSSGSLFYENVVLRQLRDQAYDELSADDRDRNAFTE